MGDKTLDFKRWLALLLVGAVVAWLAFEAIRARQAGDQARQIQVAQQQQQPLSGENGSDENRSAPKDLLPPPGNMVVAKIPTDNTWFVGMYEDGGGVEIPFRPGEYPQQSKNLTPKRENPGFVGAEQCQECHQELYDSFLKTAHYNSSRMVDAATIDGNFQPGSNTFHTSDPNVRFEMTQRDDQFCQRVYFFDWSFEVPMEIIIGSSKMAQTYLYWHQDGLYQHNVTHITDGDQWINSPGYIDGDAAYARPIPQRCLDCHTTYFDYRGNSNRFTPDSLILGITCERCHGPAADHIEYHKQNPDSEEAVAIANPEKFQRELSMEVCGQCHGGSRNLKGDALSFRPGDRLDEHYHPADDEKDAKNSVHTSNQLTRLMQSRCFEQSEMTCVNCHDPHQHERGDSRLLSDRCMTCHQQESDCGYFPQEGIQFAENCIDCHMPQRPTKKLRLKSIEGDVFPPLRDHLIRVDQQATEEFIQRLQK